MPEKTIKIPELGDVSSPQSYVIVGANGSGKSHLGARIEQNNENVLRISAQRALVIPDEMSIKSGEGALKKVLYGSERYAEKHYKWPNGKVTSTLVDDYVSVLSSMFSIESDELRKFKNSIGDGNNLEKFETITDKILGIWKKVFPQRNIKFEKFEVKAEYNTQSYKAGSMSDGERVGLYLIAQCLITPDNFTIVIDEPELHLHTSIMKRLWDEIERYCPNKTFVYITHDLRFATSRKTATKIWVKDYDGKGKWNLSKIDNNEDIPEALFLEVLGTRSPVLFVEGEKTSYDVALYKEVFDDYLVIPCSNCQKVIELTKAFNNEKVKALHEYEVKGLIDHDFLSDIEIENYKKQNIFTTEVSEVENLFLIEPLIKLTARQIGNNADEAFKQVADFLFDKMVNSKDQIVSSICIKEVRHNLKGFSSAGKDPKEITQDLNTLVSGIDVNDLFNKTESKISGIITGRKYDEMLKIFNDKGLCKQVKSKLDIKKDLPRVILDLMNTEKRDEIIKALKAYLPNLS